MSYYSWEDRVMPLNHTPIFACHQAARAKFIDFAGWEMPLHYGSQIAEHQAVRKNAGIFDVSHMGFVEIEGPDAQAFLRYLLANDVKKITPGRAIYSCMLNTNAGVIDDLIVYQLTEQKFGIVVNASRRQADLEWMQQQQNIQQQQKFTLKLREDRAILALQGPQAIAIAQCLFSAEPYKKIASLKPFELHYFDDQLIARTGYTGESGLEFIISAENANLYWKKLMAQDATPCGLGARDSLRLEAGFNLYGNDMDASVTPLESNLAWTIDWKDKTRDFIGKSSLEKQLAHGVKKKLIGISMESAGVLRHHQKIYLQQKEIGDITSGGFAPSLGYSIALARIPNDVNETQLNVERRGGFVPVNVVKPGWIKK